MSPDPDFRANLSYDPETGEFTRLTWSARCPAGSKTGSIAVNGYVHIILGGKKYYAHRLGWWFVYGSWPVKHLDHIDGNPQNNRIDNLREATQSENLKNMVHRVGVSGLPGARPKRDKWYSTISVDNKKVYLGTFKTPQEASNAYVAAKRKYHTFSPEVRFA